MMLVDTACSAPILMLGVKKKSTMNACLLVLVCMVSHYPPQHKPQSIIQGPQVCLDRPILETPERNGHDVVNRDPTQDQGNSMIGYLGSRIKLVAYNLCPGTRMNSTQSAASNIAVTARTTRERWNNSLRT